MHCHMKQKTAAAFKLWAYVIKSIQVSRIEAHWFWVTACRRLWVMTAESTPAVCQTTVVAYTCYVIPPVLQWMLRCIVCCPGTLQTQSLLWIQPSRLGKILDHHYSSLSLFMCEAIPGATSVSSRPCPFLSLKTALSVTYMISRPFAELAAKVFCCTFLVNLRDLPSWSMLSLPSSRWTCRQGTIHWLLQQLKIVMFMPQCSPCNQVGVRSIAPSAQPSQSCDKSHHWYSGHQRARPLCIYVFSAGIMHMHCASVVVHHPLMVATQSLVCPLMVVSCCWV